MPRRRAFPPKLVPAEWIFELIRRGEGADATAAAIAERQLALITTAQLNAAGLARHAITLRCRRGMLHRVHHGVYLYGQPVWLPGARELAALLAHGDSAFVSHRSAGALWGFIAQAEGEVQVTLVGKSRKSRDGIRVHCVASLPRDQQRLRDGIPITSPARTLLDFASRARPDELERAIAEAYALRLVSERELRQVLARHPRRAGAAALKAELGREGGPALTRREAERLMKLLIREAGLAPPLTNHRVEGFEADFFWPEHRLIVEVDGYQFHSHRAAFERDRRRDAAHMLAGYRVIRITWRQLTEERLAVAVIIARALEISGAGGRSHG